MELARPLAKRVSARDRRILGIDFFSGSAGDAITRIRLGGLLVVPAAPALKNLATSSTYREALLNADVVICDSSFMVLIWNLIEDRQVERLSGLKYLRALLLEDDVRRPGATFWIMASGESASKNLAWLEQQEIYVPGDHVFIAPVYGEHLVDDELLARLLEQRPRHVIITIGGGTQEKLGLYLRQRLPYLVSIHCLGAAIAFLSGDQVHIPEWADRAYLGWFFRTLSDPLRFIPRYWQARQLFPMMWRYRNELPPLCPCLPPPMPALAAEVTDERLV